MRKCEHPHRLDRKFTVMCLDCERNGIESLGPSNDDGEAVRIEILAAEVGQNHSVWNRFQDCDRRIDDDLELAGARGTLGLGTLSEQASHLDVTGGPRWTNGEIDSYLAGWLAREMSPLGDLPSVSGDYGWTWNPALPIAGQYETHLANTCNHASHPRNADGDCMGCAGAKTAAGVAQEDALRAEPAKQHADDEVLRCEAYELNAPLREAARRIIESWPDDTTPTPPGLDDDDPTDPATKFGALAKQVTVPVAAPDRFDDEAFDTSDVLPDEVAR